MIRLSGSLWPLLVRGSHYLSVALRLCTTHQLSVVPPRAVKALVVSVANLLEFGIPTHPARGRLLPHFDEKLAKLDCHANPPKADKNKKPAPARDNQVKPAYLDFDLRLRLMALQPQRSDSGIPRGVTCTQDWQVSQRNPARRVLNAATTGSKSFLPKFAHSL